MCQCGTNTHVPREKEVKYVFYNAPFLNMYTRLNHTKKKIY